MPLLLSIVGFLLPFMGSIMGRALLALGFGFVEYVGISSLVNYAVTFVNQSIGNFSSSAVGSMLQWAGFLQIDVHFSILLSAIGVKVAFNALGGSSVRRLVQK